MTPKKSSARGNRHIWHSTFWHPDCHRGFRYLRAILHRSFKDPKMAFRTALRHPSSGRLPVITFWVVIDTKAFPVQAAILGVLITHTYDTPRLPQQIVYICNLKCEPSLNHSLDGQQLINPGLAFCSTNRRSGCSQTLIFFCLNGCEIVQLCVRWSCVSTTCVNRLLFF